MYCIDEVRLNQLAELFAIRAGLKAAVKVEIEWVSGHEKREDLNESMGCRGHSPNP
ncbi:uncharacterized protein BO80DRAFT_423514 [Aspergillus ibericus CBS 121593]|uniref:Uncharacterized protein n=1 Tax=Aspergillus ibericus CBS 121593 TaxID=1448316 RepID=A0A395H5C2_9EURO|nr:hypothetical protein BO80DRAFT_423514 [Aspergillus ibericus CBS 121593]RAL03077.1 hypothetical protein BO80DRAFT_423514 [Aspergillus ibericus CBS 121593]